MNEFVFEPAPWETALEELLPGSSLSAMTLLSLLEGEEEWALEEAFARLEEKQIELNVADLPLDPGTGAAALRLKQEQELAAKGDLLTGLEENDSLRLYLQELAQTPAAGDPAVLAMEVLDGNESAAPRLVSVLLPLVIEMAKEMTGRGVLLSDLIQEGSLGLWQGILHYSGGDVEAACRWWIRQYLARAVTVQARNSGVGQKLRQGMEDYRDVDTRLLTELGRNPTLEEIAEAMHIGPEDAAVYESMVSAARSRQQVEAQREPAPEEEDADQAVEDTAYFQSRQRIEELLSCLEETDARILSLRFGLEGGLPLNPEETGKKLGMTAQDVVSREAAALAKLRQGQ